MRFVSSLILLFILTFGALWAEGDLEKLSLGEPWLNPVEKVDLEGRVVVVELWGINWGPCIGSIPHLVKMQEKYQEQGLVVIAPHVGQTNPSDTKISILARLKKMNVNYSVFGSGGVSGDEGKGIPRAFVFSYTGELKFSGHPGDGKFSSTIEDLMKTAPDFLTRGKKYEKLGSEAKSIAARKSLGKTLVTLKEKMESEDEVTKTEATELYNVLSRYAESCMNKAESKKVTNPPAVLEDYSLLAKIWKGSEYGDKADEKVKELKKDKSFQDEIKAFKMVESLEESIQEYATSESDKKRQKLSSEILGNYMAIKKKFGETQVVKNLEETLKSMGMKLPEMK